MAQQGALQANCIPYSQRLLDLFRTFFDVVRTDHDHPTAFFPYFHLRENGFWNHQPKFGAEKDYQQLRRPRSKSAITKVIEYAFLNDDLYQLAIDARSAEILRDVIIDHYFTDHKAKLLAVWQRVVSDT